MLLDDIINLAADDKEPIAVMLRKCIVLGAQLKNERLKQWASSELEGYEKASKLPDYRIVAAPAYGHFVPPTRYDSTLENYPIAPLALEKEHRKFAEHVSLFEGISSYEHLYRSQNSKESLLCRWPANLIGYYQHVKPIVGGGYTLYTAWQEIAPGALAHLLGTIRTRTLSLAIEINDELGQDIQHATPATIEKVSNSVTNHIGTVIFASGEARVQINHLNVGNWEELVQVLKQSGLADEDLKELAEADGQDKGTMGSRVKDWVTKAGPKVLVGGCKLTAEIGQKILTEVLMKHYGLSH